MNRIILNCLARWWWVLALSAFLTIACTMVGQPFVFAPALLVALLFDAGRGLFRVVRPLPVTRRAQALAWWLLAVLLLPVFSLAPLMVGTLIFEATHAPATINISLSAGGHILQTTYAPWFAAGVHTWVALGYAGFCFLVAILLPTRPGTNSLEQFGQACIGALWGLSIPGISLLLPLLPKNPATIVTWHWLLFAAAPVFVVLSLFAAPDMLQRRMFAVTSGKRPDREPEPAAAGHGLRGVPLFVTAFAGRTVGLILFMAAIQICFVRWLGSGSRTGFISMQIVMFTIIFGAMSGESLGLRSLRALPLSTTRLTALLLTIPALSGICAAVITNTWGGAGGAGVSQFLNYAAQAIALAGAAAIAMAVMLHMISGTRIFVLMLLSMIPAATFPFLAKMPVVLGLTGAGLAFLAFALVHRGVRKSNAFYQPRRFFGMTVGQPGAVR